MGAAGYRHGGRVMKRDDDMERGWGHHVIWGPFSSVTSADLDPVERAIGRARSGGTGPRNV